MRDRIGHLEITVCARSTGVNDALGNPLMIEMGNLLAERKIFKKRWPPDSGFQRILIVRDDDALIGRQRTLISLCALMCRAAWSRVRMLVLVFHGVRLSCF